MKHILPIKIDAGVYRPGAIGAVSFELWKSAHLYCGVWCCRRDVRTAIEDSIARLDDVARLWDDVATAESLDFDFS